jgi:anti-sigma factor RsiW
VTIPESHLAFEAIAALVDGELPAGPAGRAARHLERCAQCRMAVAAQREAKEALHGCDDMAVPGDLLTRLQAIPFTTDVPGGPGLGVIAAGPDQLTLRGASGAWAVPLVSPHSHRRSDAARWLRRGIAGSVALGVGLAALAVTLSAAEADNPGTTPAVARPSMDQHTDVVPPVVRTVTVTTVGGTP